MPQPGALDRLVRINPSQVANFLLASEVVRTAVTSAGETHTLLPERGSLPVYWAADGHPDEETSIVANGFTRLPIGSFDYYSPDTEQVEKGTLRREQKRAILKDHFAEINEAPRVLVIDEVQNGGTITEFVDIVRSFREKDSPRLYVIAAQDSRAKVAKGTKKHDYLEMVTGKKDGVIATTVPMPLITTDRDPLLNQLWYNGSTRVPKELKPEIEIRDNPEAELIFRVLGTATRNREALEDTSWIDQKVFGLPVGQKASARLDAWRQNLIGYLSERIS